MDTNVLLDEYTEKVIEHLIEARAEMIALGDAAMAPCVPSPPSCREACKKSCVEISLENE